MKFNYELILSDIENLLNHIENCISKGEGSSRDYIEIQYENIISKTPYDWYFCSGLHMNECILTSYESIINALEILKGRLEIAQKHRIIEIEALFKDIKPKIINEINNATLIINIAVAWLSDKDIIDAIINKALKGVFFRILLYKTESNESTIKKLKAIPNISIYSIPNYGNDGKNLMHNKFATFDTNTVITGSYNWSLNATENIENIVIILDNNIANAFSQEFSNIVSKFIKYKA